MSIARMKVTRTFTLFILLRCRLETCGGNTGKIHRFIDLFVLCPPLCCYPNKKHNNKSNVLFWDRGPSVPKAMTWRQWSPSLLVFPQRDAWWTDGQLYSHALPKKRTRYASTRHRLVLSKIKLKTKETKVLIWRDFII